MRTYSPKAGDIKITWHVIDADGMVLGRLATQVAHVLKGKHRPEYAPHCNMGDHVIIINAEKVRVTGKKPLQKIYRHHTQWRGGLRTTTYRDMQSRFPERIIHLAVKGMLPRNRLGRALLRKLRVYAGPDHPHAAQQPEVLSV